MEIPFLMHICVCMHVCVQKNPTIVNITRMVCATSMTLAAKESGLECACVNNDDFAVLVSGGVDAVE